MTLRSFLAVGALLAFALPAHAGSIDLRVFDRLSGDELPVHDHQGQRYIEGRSGRTYEIRLQNRSNQRLLAVTSVDGVNVVSGETADFGQAGYVLDPYATTRIDGWRKSLSQVAEFAFTGLDHSYAARTGRPDNVGVIGVAVFRQKSACCGWFRPDRSRSTSQSAPEADGERSQDSAGAMNKRGSLGTGHGPRDHSSARPDPFPAAGFVSDP